MAQRGIHWAGELIAPSDSTTAVSMNLDESVVSTRPGESVLSPRPGDLLLETRPDGSIIQTQPDGTVRRLWSEKELQQNLTKLDWQIAIDQHVNEGSSDALISLLAAMNGLDYIPGQTPIRVEHVKATEQDKERLQGENFRAYSVGFCDTVNDASNEFLLKSLEPKRTNMSVELLAGDALPRFAYSALSKDTDEIRLLKLVEAGESGRFVGLNVEHYPLEEAPSYNCLSYVWGASHRSISLNCNGRAIMATQNLCDALTDCFQRYNEMYLWADGICINQDDLDERAQQVRMMGKIYSKCNMALAHLNQRKKGIDKSPDPSKAGIENQRSPSSMVNKNMSPPLKNDEGQKRGLQKWKSRLSSRLRSKRPSSDVPAPVSFADAIPPSPSNDAKQEPATERSSSHKDAEEPTAEDRDSPDDKLSVRAAISLMNYMSHIWKKYPDHELILEDVWRTYQLPNAGDEGLPIWKKLLDFTCHDWFYRTWIIPECVLSPKMAILYGECVISLRAVMEFWDFASRRGLPLLLRRGELGSVFDILRHVTPVHTFRALRQQKEGSGEMDDARLAAQPQDTISKDATGSDANSDRLIHSTPSLDLLELLALCRMCFASDNRDKVYAMLSLSNDDIASSIVQDYHPTNTVSSTFINVAHRFVKADRGSQLLSYAGRHRKVSNLPSWVPDWTHQSRSRFKTQLYNCTSDTLSTIALCDEKPNMIKLRAAVIAEIANVSELVGVPWRYYSSGEDKFKLLRFPVMPHQMKTGEEETLSEMSDEEARCVTMKKAMGIATWASEYVNELYPEGLRQAVARTLCADVSWDGKRIKKEEGALESFMESFEAFEKFYARPVFDEGEAKQMKEQGKFVWDSGTMKWLNEIEEYGAESVLRKIWPFAMALQEVQRGRKFVLMSGGLLAMVPWDAKGGDSVVMVQGAKVPFLVRSVDQGDGKKSKNDSELKVVELVGDCYVHGLMDGEWLLQGSVEGPDAEMMVVKNKDGKSYVGKWPNKEKFMIWKDMLIR